MKKERLIIFDSNSILHRAYHALPRLTTKKGEMVNAVYGFLLVFFKTVKEFQPDYIYACFDFPAKTFRHKEFKEYKATRPPTPKDLVFQIPKIKEILKSFNVPIFEKEGFEADDLIGTIVWQITKIPKGKDLEIIIISGDLDTLQLVDWRTKVYSLKKGVKDIVLYDENLVKARYQGLAPFQLIDFKALKGDPSDNIPGVTGVGEKTAMELILKFGSLENLYKELEEHSENARSLKPKLKETLLKFKEQAFFSKKLVQIKKNAPIDLDLEKCQWGKFDKEKVAQILKELEFESLIARLSSINTQKDLSQREKIKENLKLL